jgi:undecaprenyl-diphosphatase
MQIDIAIFYFLNNLAGVSPLTDAIILFFAEYLAYILIVIFFSLLIYLFYKKFNYISLMVNSFLSTAISMGLLSIIHLLYHRARPFLTYQVHHLNWWPLTETGYSFPSKHVTFFFALATAVYLYNKKWGIWFFIASILMGVARVAAGVHYPSDILGGMIIGIFVAYVIYYFAEKRRTKKIPKV